MSDIRIYIEGGGDKDSKARMREAFSKFLAAPRDAARQRRVSWTLKASTPAMLARTERGSAMVGGPFCVRNTTSEALMHLSFRTGRLPGVPWYM